MTVKNTMLRALWCCAGWGMAFSQCQCLATYHPITSHQAGSAWALEELELSVYTLGQRGLERATAYALAWAGGEWEWEVEKCQGGPPRHDMVVSWKQVSDLTRPGWLEGGRCHLTGGGGGWAGRVTYHRHSTTTPSSQILCLPMPAWVVNRLWAWALIH